LSIPSLSLEGKIALVTGARRGLGKGIALAFAEAGADVAVCDNVIEDGELVGVAEEVKKFSRSLAIQADVTNKSDADNLVKKVVDEFGRIHILVNAAGVLGSGPVIENSEQAWDSVLDTNLKGTFLCSQAVSKIMIDQRMGNVINMASVAGFRGGTTYSISKAGVVMLTRAVARNLAPYNIRVNAIAPYVTRTEKEAARTMSESFWSDSDAIARAETMAPMGRLGEVADIAGAALFLASEAASFVTGHTLVVDGGFLA